MPVSGHFSVPGVLLHFSKSMCNLVKSSPPSHVVAVILATDLILVDEAPMMHKHCFDALDNNSLRDLTGVEEPFGGKGGGHRR